MEIKILQVFYGKDGLPYKDKDRQVHFPIAGTGFLGASKTTKIKFYYDELDNLDETTWVAVSKLPNGKVGSRVLESYLDDELNEHYALLEIDNYYTQYKGDVFISLQGYQGGVNLDYNEENSQYEIHGTPTIAATGSIKFTINYANQFVGSGQTDNINFQRILAALGTKLGMRAYSEHVEELPSEGSPDVFYVVNDDPNNTNLANIYVWNENTRHYIWVGDNTLDLGEYYTKEQGEQFENDVNETLENYGDRIESVESELSNVAQGSPKGVYATLADLQAAYPTGTTGIYVVSADGHWYYWNGSAWTDGGTYQATQIADGSITYTKLADSLKDAYVKKFIDDSAKITLNRYQEYNGDHNYSYNGMSLVQVDVRYGEKIKYGFTLVSPDSRGLAFYDKNGTYLSGVQVSTTEQIINVPRLAVLCKATIHTGLYYELQIVKDCFDLENEIIDQKIDVDLLKSKSEKLDFINTGNLYDGTNYEDGYYNNSGSITGVAAGTYHNMTIPVVEGDVIRAKYDTADLYNQNGCMFKGDTFVTANRYNETLVDSKYYEIIVPQGVDNIRLNFKSTSGYVVIKNSTYNANAQVGKCYMPNLDLSAQIDEQLDDRGIALKDDVSYAHIFRKVACIGDSITVGYYGDSGGVVYGTFPNYNYPSFLEKLIDCETVNLGWSGQSAQTWYQGYSTHFASADIDWAQYDAAIIFLGTNGGLSGNVDPDDNSQMGYYCKIIEMLLAANPQISIFLCTSPWTGNKEELYPNLDTQVIACGTHYNLPVLRLDKSSLLTYEQRTINQPYDNRLHFGRVGLMRIASEIVRCINENGASNPSYFNKLYGTHY